MPLLKSLAFAAIPKVVNDPVLTRRTQLVVRLEEQLTLLQNPDHTRTRQRWVVVDGEKRLVSKDQRVKPWWGTDNSGHVFMTVRFGGRPVEFEKGKAAVAVASKEKLPAVIDTLTAAARAGELDEILTQASKQRPVPEVPQSGLTPLARGQRLCCPRHAPRSRRPDRTTPS